eukprot:5114448-Pyramimonas_sp.AAC.1
MATRAAVSGELEREEEAQSGFDWFPNSLMRRHGTSRSDPRAQHLFCDAERMGIGDRGGAGG